MEATSQDTGQQLSPSAWQASSSAPLLSMSYLPNARAHGHDTQENASQYKRRSPILVLSVSLPSEGMSKTKCFTCCLLPRLTQGFVVKASTNGTLDPFRPEYSAHAWLNKSRHGRITRPTRNSSHLKTPARALRPDVTTYFLCELWRVVLTIHRSFLKRYVLWAATQ